MNLGCTGVGTSVLFHKDPDSGYCRVTGFRKPFTVETKVNKSPFRLLSIYIPLAFI